MSANRVVRMLSGADSVLAANAYRLAVQDRRDSWPYVHVYPPPSATDVFKVSTIAVEMAGTGPIEILKYTVNAGKVFYLRAVLFSASSSIVAGDALFTLDRNSAIGVTNSQFQPEHGLVNVPVALGSSVTVPWKLSMARIFAANDVIRIKGTNVNLSGGTSYVCGIFGYEVPSLDVKTKR
jgi:hypothetical protein